MCVCVCVLLTFHSSHGRLSKSNSTHSSPAHRLVVHCKPMGGARVGGVTLRRWLAKVSDYGTANFQSKLQTENPGSPVYTAPESRDPALQTPKMDIYSFGVLLVEMSTCQFPAPEHRDELIDSIDHPGLVNLVVGCLNEDKNRRPTAAQVIDILPSMQ